MNKETRTWLTGAIYFIMGNLLIFYVLEIKPKDTVTDGCYLIAAFIWSIYGGKQISK